MVRGTMHLWVDESGQDMIEYALLVALAAVLAASVPFQGTLTLVSTIHSKVVSVLARHSGGA